MVDLIYLKYPGCDVVCNKAVYEHGDYKTVAHISHSGVVKMFVGEGYLSEKDKARIEKWATRNREEFDSKLDSEIAYTEANPNDLYASYRLYDRMCSCLTYREQRAFDLKHEGESRIDKIKAMRPIYTERA